MAIALGIQSATQRAGDNAELQKFLLDYGEILNAQDHYRSYREAQARAHSLPWTVPFALCLSARPTLSLSDRDQMLGPMLTSISSFMVHWRNQRRFYEIAVVGSGGDTWLDQTSAGTKFAFPIGRNQFASGGRRWKMLMRIDEHFAEVYFHLQSSIDGVSSAPSCYIFASGISSSQCLGMNLRRPVLALHSHVEPAFSMTPLSTGGSLRSLPEMDDEVLVEDLMQRVRDMESPTHYTRPYQSTTPMAHWKNTTPRLEIPVSNTDRNIRKIKSIGNLPKRLLTRIRSGSG